MYVSMYVCMYVFRMAPTYILNKKNNKEFFARTQN